MGLCCRLLSPGQFHREMDLWNIGRQQSLPACSLLHWWLERKPPERKGRAPFSPLKNSPWLDGLNLEVASAKFQSYLSEKSGFQNWPLCPSFYVVSPVWVVAKPLCHFPPSLLCLKKCVYMWPLSFFRPKKVFSPTTTFHCHFFLGIGPTQQHFWAGSCRHVKWIPEF